MMRGNKLRRLLGRRLRLGRWSVSTGVVIIGVVILLAGGGAVYARLGGGFGDTGGTVNLQKGLRAWYKLDGNVKDSTPYAHDGTLVGAPSYVADREAKAGAALGIASSGHRIDNAGVDIGSDWSVSVWSPYPNNGLEETGHWRTLLRGSAGDHQVIVQSGGYALGTYDNTGGTSFRACTPTFNVNTLSAGWHNFTITQTGGSTGTMTFYVDGEEKCTVAGYGSTTDIRSIGNYWGGGQEWGTIDDVRIYDRAVSAAEAKALYEQYDAQVNAASGEKGLVGWWKMDGNAKDATPYANNGTISGATLTTDRKGTSNRAYSFNGSYINMGQPSPLRMTGSFTISAWVKTTQTNQGGIVTKWYNTNGNRSYRFYMGAGGSINLGLSSDGTNSIACGYGAAVNDGNWNHVSAAYNSVNQTVVIYKNGVALTTCTAGSAGIPSSVFDNAMNFQIGLSDSGVSAANGFNGSIDDVRIYNREVSSQEISAQHRSYNSQINLNSSPTASSSGGNINSGLIGYWPFNSNAKDVTPYQSDGIVNGAVLTADRQGAANRAYSFNGTNQHISMPMSSVMSSPMTAATVSFWARPQTATNTAIIQAYPDSSSNRFNIHFPWGNGSIYWDFGSCCTLGRLSTPFNSGWYNTWAFWTFTVDPVDGMKIYRNGVVIASNSNHSTFDGNGKVIDVGRYTGSSFWPGSADDIRIYSRALSVSEITTLYNNYY